MALKNCYKCFTVSLVPVVALILAIVFAGGIIVLPVVYEEMTFHVKFGAVVDAGSSHTVLYLYKWRVSKTATEASTAELQQIFDTSIRKALNSYEAHPELAGTEVLGPLLNVSYMQNIIGEEDMENTEIVLGATAGMRLVQWENASASAAIMTSVRNILSSSNYLFCRADIISGMTEAASGWVSINYISKKIPPPKRVALKTDNTVGSLDMGGASAEIAWLPSKSPSPAYAAKEQLFGREYSLYARSYLCYGLIEAKRRFLAHLIDLSTNKTVVSDPCLFADTNVTYTHNDIYSICVNGSKGEEIFGYRLSPTATLAEGKNVTFVGTNETGRCQQVIATVFNLSACAINGTCVNGSYSVPPLEGNFIAHSGFYFLAEFFKVSNMKADGRYLNGAYRSSVETYCNSSFKKEYARHPKDTMLKLYCFEGLFVLHLLTEGLGFVNTSTSNISFAFTLNNMDLDWAMGYFTNITSSIPPKDYKTEHPYTIADLVVGMIVLSILSVVFLVFFLLTFQACRRIIATRSGYTDIS